MLFYKLFLFYICINSITMIAKIYITGKIGKDTTLVDVIRQYKSYEDPESVLAIIDSVGGKKEEGDNIYNYLDGLKAELPVNTYTIQAYSISAKIFAVGQEREVKDIDKALMIHNPWAEPKAGGADYFEAIAEELRNMENEFTGFYSTFLNVDEDTVHSLLDSETFISGTEAVDLGFATKLKVTAEAVAEYNSNTNFNIKKMTEKKKSKGQILLAAMAAFVGVEINAELTLQDSNGDDIVFPNLDEGASPKVGEAATMDGTAIKDNSYIIPSLEEATYVFVDGKVSEIIPKEEETEEEKTARIALEAEAALKVKKDKKLEIKAEELKEVFTYSAISTNTSFNEGETLMLEGWDGGEDYAASAGEFKKEDGSSIITDASGVIVKVKPAVAEVPAVEPEASFEELLEKVTGKVTTDIKAEFDTKLLEMETENKALKAKIGSKEFNAESKGGIAPKVTGKKSMANILSNPESKK